MFFFIQPSIFEGLGEEMAISSASLLKPRKRLILKNKDKESSSTSGIYVGEEGPSSNTPTIPIIERETPFKSTKQLQFDANLENSTGTYFSSILCIEFH